MADIEVIESYQKRAEEDLKAAEQMLASKFHLAAISLAYYAVFYAIIAALLAKGIKARKHKQLGIEFRRVFIKTEILPKKYSAILDALFHARQTADYDAVPKIEQEDVQKLLEDAKEFVTVLNKLDSGACPVLRYGGRRNDG